MSGATGKWQIGFGQVMHRRLRPTINHFVYRCFFIQGEIDRGSEPLTRSGNWLFGINRHALISFREDDHGDGRPARQWLNDILADAGLPSPAGVSFRGFARVLGYTFKPVSFWFCRNEQGERYAIVAEVNNTFGERHCYLLSNSGRALKNGQLLQAKKIFHVSPFCEVNGTYQFRFSDQANRNVVRIDHATDEGGLLETSMSGELVNAVPRQIVRAMTAYPFFTLGVMARIHWQALRLWLMKVPFFRKPNPPSRFVSNGSVSPSHSMSNR
jgi:DUF1365 family protein